MLDYTIQATNDVMVIRFSKAPSRQTRAKLANAGFGYAERYTVWKAYRNWDTGRRIAEQAKRESAAHERRKNCTLCWDCVKAGDGNLSECPWVREFKPVDGWTAVATKVKVTDGKPAFGYKTQMRDSYYVSECPMFEPDPPRSNRVQY